MTVLQDADLTVVELRRYTLLRGRRDDLIDVFERELVESQEAVGMLPIGHFRDLDDADSFVWIRGFADMKTRRDALGAFYLGSAAWKNNRDAANATMIDSNNVLLLRPARPSSGFNLAGLRRPEPRSTALHNAGHAASLYGVAVMMLNARAGEDIVASFERDLLPKLEREGRGIAYFVTEERLNDFPRLPVREGEWALVIAGACDGVDALDRWSRLFDQGAVPAPILRRLVRCEILRLEPAPRSLLR